MKKYIYLPILFFLLMLNTACRAENENITLHEPTHTKATDTSSLPTPTNTKTKADQPAKVTTTPEPITPTVIEPSPTKEIITPTPTLNHMQEESLANRGYAPFFEPGDCQFIQPHRFELECGYLVVPEDRSQPNGRLVRLHVAIFKSRSQSPEPDPVIYLTGGGGGNELDRTTRYLDDGNEVLLDQRDFIMYNQRGVKYNIPYLECHGYEDYMIEVYTSNLSRIEEESRQVDYFKKCHDELVNMGIDLNMYNTTVNAADLNDLRIALGYEQINIYGTSYGTHLALFIIREFGDHIRSAIIDSVYPPQVHYFSTFATNANNTFERIFTACLADEYCNQQYPELENTFYQVVKQLNDHPRNMELPGNEGIIQYDGYDFILVMYLLPYISRPELLPMYVYQASQGDYSNVEEMIPYTLDTGSGEVIADGVYNSILCREEIPYDSYEQLVKLGALLPPEIAATYDSTLIFDLCDVWGVEAADPSEREPVTSDVPTLILEGEFDPITPPEWGRLAGETLSNSYYFEFPGHGHGVMRSVPCGFRIGLQFLNDPFTQPDSSCIDYLPGIVFE